MRAVSALPRVHGAALRTGTGLHIVIERGEDRREINDDIAYLQLDLVYERGAIPAVPLELLRGPLFTDPFDDQPDRSGFRRTRRE